MPVIPRAVLGNATHLPRVKARQIRSHRVRPFAAVAFGDAKMVKKFDVLFMPVS